MYKGVPLAFKIMKKMMVINIRIIVTSTKGNMLTSGGKVRGEYFWYTGLGNGNTNIYFIIFFKLCVFYTYSCRYK